MKKIIFLFFALLLQNVIIAQNTEQMVFSNNFRAADAGVANLTSMFMQDSWWNDANGETGAVLRIKVTDMSIAEMKRLSIQGSPNAGIGERHFLEKEQQWVVAVTAGKSTNMYIEFVHPTFGTSSRLSIPVELKQKTIYDVTLVNKRTTTIVVRSLPDGADVYLDGDKKGTTPCEIPGQKFGKHELKILYGGKSKVETIEVEEGHTVFDKFDFRERQMINITSDPNGAAIYIDGEHIGRAPIYNYNILTGAHTFKAQLNASQIDEQNLNITKQTTEVAMHPIKKANVNITTKYAGRPVDATLVVDNEKSYSGDVTYNMVLPYGKHIFRTSYLGKSKEKQIKINRPEVNHEFRLSAKNDFVWPWQRDYDAAPFGVHFAYVQKQMVTKGEGEKYKENGIWEDGDNKWLHGIQVGFHANPCLSFGLGFYTGVFYEYYFSSNDSYDYNKFEEHNINIPVHGYYRLPLANKVALNVHGGLGINYVVYGAFKDSNDQYEEVTDFYGEDGCYGRFNLTADIACGLRMGSVMLQFQYSKGINNHGSYEFLGDYKTTVNKMSIGLSYVIGGDD